MEYGCLKGEDMNVLEIIRSFYTVVAVVETNGQGFPMNVLHPEPVNLESFCSGLIAIEEYNRAIESMMGDDYDRV